MIHLGRWGKLVSRVLIGSALSAANRRNFLSTVWVYKDMQSVLHWFATSGSVIAVMVTVGVAVLLVCCLGCSNCSSRDKDSIFGRHEL